MYCPTASWYLYQYLSFEVLKIPVISVIFWNSFVIYLCFFFSSFLWDITRIGLSHRKYVWVCFLSLPSTSILAYNICIHLLVLWVLKYFPIATQMWRNFLLHLNILSSLWYFLIFIFKNFFFFFFLLLFIAAFFFFFFFFCWFLLQLSNCNKNQVTLDKTQLTFHTLGVYHLIGSAATILAWLKSLQSGKVIFFFLTFAAVKNVKKVFIYYEWNTKFKHF